MFDCIVVGVITLGAFWLMRKLAGWLVSFAILPSQRQPKGLRIPGEFFVPIKNGRLSTLEITPNPQIVKAPATGQYIISFCYKDRAYTHPSKMQDMQVLANDNNATVVAFDYPNVGNSLGMVNSQTHLVKAGIAQVERLLEDGVPAYKITLYGHSLGGAVATLVADHFHQEKTPIALINDRSFSTLGDAIGGWSKGPIFLKKMISTFAKGIAWTVGWPLNAKEAYQRIPDEYKMHIVSKVDSMIDYKMASLHKQVRPLSKNDKAYVYKIGGDHNGHTKPLHILVDNKLPCTPIHTHIARFIGRHP